MKPPPPSAPPSKAWSKVRGSGPFHPKSHFCTHCSQEIGPGDKLWFKGAVVLCQTCQETWFPVFKN